MQHLIMSVCYLLQIIKGVGGLRKVRSHQAMVSFWGEAPSPGKHSPEHIL